jgi:hypothetical protein
MLFSHAFETTGCTEQGEPRVRYHIRPTNNHLLSPAPALCRT